MSCGSHHSAWARRAEVELLKQQQRQLWAAALSSAVTGAVTGAVNGARGAAAGAQVRIGDAERDAAVAALGEHYVAGRLDKDELDERAAAAWSARTGSDLARLFHDLPPLQPAPPARPPRRHSRARSFRLAAMLSWVLVLLVALAVASDVPWFAVAIFVGLWWTGVFSGLHRWARWSSAPRSHGGSFGHHH